MKSRILFLLLVTTSALGQTIQNPGFEVPQNTNRLLPQAWELDHKASYSVTLDSSTAKSGRYSLLITSLTDTASGSSGFSQRFKLHLNQPALVHLRGFIKTDNPAGVGVWWNSWSAGKHKGFAHSQQQVTLSPTDQWQPLDLVLPTSTDIDEYSLGAYLQGRGRVWFDDLQVEPVAANTTEPSGKVKAYLEKVMALVKKHALVSDSIPWPQTQAELMGYARGLQTEPETYPLIHHLLNLMRHYGDNHSFFLNPQGVALLEGDASTAQPSEVPQSQARYLGDCIGYVAVPRFWGANKQRETAFATQTQGLIRQLDSANTVSGWVVDLRGNTGGNVFPMVAGLRPLYGKNAKRSYKRALPKGSYRLRQAPNRIAILLDGQTASSGEFTALSFIGLPHVRSFGQPTAGYTTGNADYKLSDGAMLFIAGMVGEDRRGKKYPHGLLPDEPIKELSTANSDPTLEAAKVWLLAK